MDNPQTKLEKLDVAANYVGQIGVFLAINAIDYARDCQQKAMDLLHEVIMEEVDNEMNSDEN